MRAGVDLSYGCTATDAAGRVPAHAGGVDLSSGQNIYVAFLDWVPAHAGGVDLSNKGIRIQNPDCVPAHAGGVDLS